MQKNCLTQTEFPVAFISLLVCKRTAPSVFFPANTFHGLRGLHTSRTLLFPETDESTNRDELCITVEEQNNAALTYKTWEMIASQLPKPTDSESEDAFNAQLEDVFIAVVVDSQTDTITNETAQSSAQGSFNGFQLQESIIKLYNIKDIRKVAEKEYNLITDVPSKANALPVDLEKDGAGAGSSLSVSSHFESFGGNSDSSVSTVHQLDAHITSSITHIHKKQSTFNSFSHKSVDVRESNPGITSLGVRLGTIIRSLGRTPLPVGGVRIPGEQNIGSSSAAQNSTFASDQNPDRIHFGSQPFPLPPTTTSLSDLLGMVALFERKMKGLLGHTEYPPSIEDSSLLEKEILQEDLIRLREVITYKIRQYALHYQGTKNVGLKLQKLEELSHLFSKFDGLGTEVRDLLWDGYDILTWGKKLLEQELKEVKEAFEKGSQSTKGGKETPPDSDQESDTETPEKRSDGDSDSKEKNSSDSKEENSSDSEEENSSGSRHSHRSFWKEARPEWGPFVKKCATAITFEEVVRNLYSNSYLETLAEEEKENRKRCEEVAKAYADLVGAQEELEKATKDLAEARAKAKSLKDRLKLIEQELEDINGEGDGAKAFKATKVAESNQLVYELDEHKTHLWDLKEAFTDAKISVGVKIGMYENSSKKLLENAQKHLENYKSSFGYKFRRMYEEGSESRYYRVYASERQGIPLNPYAEGDISAEEIAAGLEIRALAYYLASLEGVTPEPSGRYQVSYSEPKYMNQAIDIIKNRKMAHNVYALDAMMGNKIRKDAVLRDTSLPNRELSFENPIHVPPPSSSPLRATHPHSVSEGTIYDVVGKGFLLSIFEWFF